MTRMQCIVCGQATDTVPSDAYLEISIRLPNLEDRFVQTYGAHRRCFDESVAVGYQTAGPVVTYESPEVNPRIIAVPPYDPDRGVHAEGEGRALAECSADGVVISADADGLRGLARWLLAASHPDVPDRSALRLSPGQIPLTPMSAPVTIARTSHDDFV